MLSKAPQVGTSRRRGSAASASDLSLLNNAWNFRHLTWKFRRLRCEPRYQPEVIHVRFGEGYYNGFGGKVEEGETIEQAAVRELKEEAGISPIGMTKLGILIFHFDDKPCPWEVHVFNVPEFTGEPCESDEMLPTWFAHEQIPFETMWKDETVWYPLFLKGQKFKGEFFFQDTHKLLSYKCEVVESL